MNIVEKARIFATAAHAAQGQVRKYTNEPYIVHPHDVAQIVRSVGGTDNMVAAAYLHDTLEDTHVTLDLLRTEFGNEIATLVLWLTDVSQPTDGPRSTRKEIDRLHSASAPGEAQTIKVADLISNTNDIVQHDPKFAVVYLVEKRLLLTELVNANPTLLARAWEHLIACEEILDL